MSWNLSLKLNNLTNYVYSVIPSSGVGIFNTLTATTGIIPTLSSTSISSGTLTCGNITGTQTFNLSSGIGISTDGAGQIGMLLTTPNASKFTVGQSVYIQGTDNGYYNNRYFTITVISLPNIIQTNNPYGIPSYQYGAGGTVSSGSITTLDLTATNLNGKLNIVGATNNSGNLILCNNTTNTTGNYDLLTDSNQHLKFTATNNVLTVGGATNGSIVVPSTAGFITVNKVSSNTTTALTLNSNNTGSLGEIVLQKGGTTYATIQNANAQYNLQLFSESGVSIDTKNNSNINLATNGSGTINLITGSVVRASVTANGIVTTKYANAGNNNVFLEAYFAGANPALIFNANSYDNANLVGRYMTINQSGIGFYDGKSTGETLRCGINNLGFYVPSAGYFLNGSTYNVLIGSIYNNADIIIYNNAGGSTVITSLGGSGAGRTVVTSNTGVLSSIPSDERLKKDKIPLTSCLSKLLLLNPITYKWDEESDMKEHPLYDDELQYGFTAQNIQSHYPDFIYPLKIKENTYYGYDDKKLQPIIVKAIQEQQELIINQQKQIDELKLLVEKLLNK